jgi:hypothetical protein
MKQSWKVFALSAAVFAGSAASAAAVTSYQGDDYAYDYSAARYIAACDREADGNEVKGVYDFNNSGGSNGSVLDSDGSNGNCASRNTGGTIYRHRTCEAINFWPDNCGNWVAP